MTIGAVNSSLITPTSYYRSDEAIPISKERTHLLNKQSTIDARIVSEYYSSDSISFNYISKDGDTISISMQSLEYSKALLEVSGKGDKEDLEKIVEYIKNSYDMIRKELLKGFLKSIGIDIDIEEEKSIEDLGDSELVQLPEYWNAENTSQRIVDFAVSFFGFFNGKTEEFTEIIKKAIDEGFKQARELLGNLADSVSNLIDSTYRLTMEKIDKWAQLQVEESEKACQKLNA